MRETLRVWLGAAFLLPALAACDIDSKPQARNDSTLVGASNVNVKEATTPGAADPRNWPGAVSPIRASDDVEERITALMNNMSAAQKVGQIVQADIASVTPEDVRNYHLGSVLNGGNSAPGGKQYAPAEEWLALADEFYDASMATDDASQAIPLLWGSDAVHGHANVIGATVFPHNIALGATRNTGLIRKVGRITAREMRVTGIGWTFAPTLAVARDDRWGRTYESYSENPALVTEYARAMFEGLQGSTDSDTFMRGERVIATAKHFIADGGTFGGRDQGDAQISEVELTRIHAMPYVAAIESGAMVVMASFSSWQGSKIHGNQTLLTDVLKSRMGFDGFIVGDWNAHGQLPGCSKESCPQAINAGLDMFMAPDSWRKLYDNTLQQVEDGDIPMSRLDDAVRRILRVKMLAGAFDQGRPSSRPLAGDVALLAAPQHRAVARQAVRESLVLLKNQNGVLPLAADSRVLVTGDGADNLAKQTGGWTLTWQGSDVPRSDYLNADSIYDGIAARVKTAGGTVTLSPDGSYAERPDVAIVVFGENPYAEYQGDREHLQFANRDSFHLRVMRKLRQASIPVVAVFLSGRPMWVNPEINAADAFVTAWLPGSEGAGVADVVFGDYDFVGKLPFSWPESATALHNVGDTDYKPLFPFGYGLTTQDTDTLSQLAETSGLSEQQGLANEVLFANGLIAKPWSLQLSDGSNQSTDATTGNITSSSKRVSVSVVDGHAQEDSRRLVWSGNGQGRAAISRSGSVNWSGRSSDALSLIVDLRVDAAPSERVVLSVTCGPTCRGDIDATKTLREAAANQFTTLSIPLACFAAAGADMTTVQSAFVVSTTGTLDLTIAGLRLGPSADDGFSCD